MKYDLSILIPARNEMFLAKTVEGLLANKRGKTEVIVGLDGQWADPPIVGHPDLTIVYYPESIGQRAMTNQLARISRAKYVMKIDAHCVVDEGFDVKLMADMQDNWTVIPFMYNLHAFDWVCIGNEKRTEVMYVENGKLPYTGCGNRAYQGPTPEKCEKCGGNMERELIWRPRENKRSDFYRFDKTLHFQYWGSFKNRPEANDDIVEVFSIQGSCFMLTRDKYWELNICDEAHGSWGQQGVEVACKTWLSGGRLVVNRKTWYSHMFRTQGGDFNFPYPMKGSDQEKAREFSRDLWFNNKWDKQIHPLSWLIEKFRPVPEFHDEADKEAQQVLAEINKAGEEFYKIRNNPTPPTKGIIYYTDNQLNLKISHAVQKQLKKIGLPIVSTSLKPMDFGKNIVVALQRGYEAYFTQIVTALENLDTDIVFMCEHDWLYHPSHFKFTPLRNDVYYYNDNWWRVRSSDGHAVHYNTTLLPNICGYRKLLLAHYKEQLKRARECNFDVKSILRMGFEPGTHNRPEKIDDYRYEMYHAEYPNIDIRHTNNLTASKWSPDEFRNPKNAEGWVEEHGEIPGWGKIYGRFDEFIKDI